MAKSLLRIKIRLRHINRLISKQKNVGMNVIALENVKRQLLNKRQDILDTIQTKNALLDLFIELG